MSGEPYDTTRKFSQYDRTLTTKKYENSTWTLGSVGTQWGFVSVSCFGMADGRNVTRLEFIHEGYNHTRTIKKDYTERGLVTVARRYAKAIVEATQ